jgi:hypothetical protein
MLMKLCSRYEVIEGRMCCKKQAILDAGEDLYTQLPIPHSVAHTACRYDVVFRTSPCRFDMHVK